MIRLFQWNVRGLLNSGDELRDFVSRYTPDILCLQECWVESGFTFPLLDYIFYVEYASRDFQFGRCKGGLVIAIRRGFFKMVQCFLRINGPIIEALGLHFVMNDGSSWRITTVYAARGIPSADCLDVLQEACRACDVALILGDFNARHVDWDVRSNVSGQALRMWMFTHGLNLVWSTELEGPTYEMHRFDRSLSSHPDTAFCNAPGFFSRSWKLSMIDVLSSDHCPLIYDANWSVSPPRTISMLDIQQAADRFAALSVEAPPASWCSALVGIVEQCRFNITKRTRSQLPQWWTPTCAAAVRLRRRTYNSLRRRYTDEKRIAYIMAQRYARATIRTARRGYLGQLFTSVGTGSPAFYRAVASVLSPPSVPCSTTVLAEREELERTTLSLANRWADVALPSPVADDCTTDNWQVSVPTIQTALTRLRDSSPGLDGVTKKAVQRLFTAHQEAFCRVVTEAINGAIPAAWKSAKIVLIPKGDGSKRPISMTSLLGKLLELIWVDEAERFLEERQVLLPHQVGFRRGEGVFGPLTAVELEVKLCREEGYSCVLVSLDLQSAYCMVPRQRLLSKIASYDPPRWMLAFIHNFLSSRTFQCSMGGMFGACLSQNRGVPQGCVSSPLLFNWYLSDMPQPPPGIRMWIYADDILILGYAPTRDMAVARCNEYLSLLVTWCCTNAMTINAQKCSVLFPFSRASVMPAAVVLNGHPLTVVSEMRFLGVLFTRNMTSGSQLARNVDLAVKRLPLFRRLFGRLSPVSFSQRVAIYKQYIRPRLEYGLLAQRRTLVQARRIDQAERTLLRTLLNLPLSTNSDALMAQTGLHALSCRLGLLALRAHMRVICSSLCRLYHPLHRVALDRQWRFANRPCYVDFLQDLRPLVDRGLHYWHVLRPLPILQENLVPSPKSHDGRAVQDWSAFIQHQLRLLLGDDFVVVATDGSVRAAAAACSVVGPDFTVRCRLPDYSDSFSAEVAGLDVALEHLLHSKQTSSVALLVDCRSVLTWLKQGARDCDSYMIWRKLYEISSARKIVLVWVPSHVGFTPNEQADTAAKLALSIPMDAASLPDVCYGARLVCARRFRSDLALEQCARVLRLEVRYFHLREPVGGLFVSVVADWFWIRLRLRRPMWRIGQVRLASVTGSCIHCTDTGFTVTHYLFDCPAYGEPRATLLRAVKQKLRVQSVSEDCLLTCGATFTGAYHVQRYVAASMANYFKATFNIASRLTPGIT